MNKPIHIRETHAFKLATECIHLVECSKCHIVKEIDGRTTDSLPECQNCGVTIWLYFILASALANLNIAELPSKQTSYKEHTCEVIPFPT